METKVRSIKKDMISRKGRFLGLRGSLELWPCIVGLNWGWLGSVDSKSDPDQIIHVFCSFINQKGDFWACYGSNKVNLRKALWADLKRLSSVVIYPAWIVMRDLNSFFHEEKMAGSGRSQNTDLHQCFLDIDLFDLPFKVRARSTLGPTAEIVSRLLPGSLTECRLITVGLLLSRTLKQTSQGQVFPIIPRR